MAIKGSFMVIKRQLYANKKAAFHEFQVMEI